MRSVFFKKAIGPKNFGHETVEEDMRDILSMIAALSATLENRKTSLKENEGGWESVVLGKPQ